MSRKKNIDALDVDILNELQRNAHLTNLKLAENVNLSPGPTLKRVKNLMSKGAIEGIYGRVSRKFFGYSYKTYLKFTIPKNHTTEFVSELVKHPRIVEVHSLHPGREESKGMLIMCLLESKNFDQFKTQYEQLIQQKDYLLNIEVINIADTVKICGALVLDDTDIQ